MICLLFCTHLYYFSQFLNLFSKLKITDIEQSKRLVGPPSPKGQLNEIFSEVQPKVTKLMCHNSSVNVYSESN